MLLMMDYAQRKKWIIFKYTPLIMKNKHNLQIYTFNHEE